MAHEILLIFLHIANIIIQIIVPVAAVLGCYYLYRIEGHLAAIRSEKGSISSRMEETKL